MMKGKTLLILAALAAQAVSAADFADGVFIVNEDWYGHHNSTVNYFDHNAADVWQYRVIQAANPGMELGCTTQFGTIYGGRFYLISKQDKDPGASVSGGRITVCDASTLKILYQSALIDPSGRQCDGRGYLGVDEHKGYISSSNGIWVFDTDTYTVTGQVEGSANPDVDDDKPNTDPSGSLYHGQCGSMVRYGQLVFAAHQSLGLLVIDPATDSVVKTLDMALAGDGAGIGSVVLAADGMLYLSIARNVQGTGATLPYIMRVDPVTFEQSLINVPEGIYPPANSWYAWTPDGFCADPHEAVLYWNGGPNSWFSNARVYRYDISTGKFTCIVNLDEEAESQGLTDVTRWNLYGCSMRPHPVSGELYMSLFHYFQNPTYKLRRVTGDGEILGEYDMIQNYWFPSVPVFPDNAAPELHAMGVQSVGSSGTTAINLAGFATDADGLDAAIVYTVRSVSDPAALEVSVEGQKLLVTPLGAGDKDVTITIEANSNGLVAEGEIVVAFDGASAALNQAHAASLRYDGCRLHAIACEGRPVEIYNPSGRKVMVWSPVSDDDSTTLNLATGLYVARCGGAVAKIYCR